ncbi:hypothetical protein IGI04_014762 [Brassica rapa subsp. trilocularis]|uniref:Uncharacterized protein n=1 Tax=Brassica rapa subsp. trilocularis TaxID=1813537 RepID=A0ABQ7MN61_BRACM|nr:hypothetical protein IGI04_014762 [Brassica rapa subsp. trilocularis]
MSNEKLFGTAITPDWNDTASSLLRQARTRIDYILRKMAFQTVIYSIWREHNSRRHGGVWITTEQLTRNIDK